jgi:hypothetical protein
MLAQVVKLSGGGTMSLRGTKNRQAREGVKTFESVSVLYGRGENLEVRAVSDTLKPVPVVESRENGTLITWHFGRPVQKATLTFKGSAEIYAVGADGEHGVAVDNIPLRGCSGTIFTRISKPLMDPNRRYTRKAFQVSLQLVRLFHGKAGSVPSSISPSCRVPKQVDSQAAARLIQYLHSHRRPPQAERTMP